jgi:hypothetical protein
MQQLYGKKNELVIRKTARQMLYLALAVVAMFQSGCAVKTFYRFSAKSVTHVSYDPKNCVETPDGKFKCNNVVFTVATIEPVKSK